MRPEIQDVIVHSQNPPTIEVDSEAPAVYVRFKNSKVAKTLSRPSRTMIIAIDLDSKGDVVGIEMVGMREFGIKRIQTILQKAEVRTPNTDFTNVRYIAASNVHA